MTNLGDVAERLERAEAQIKLLSAELFIAGDMIARMTLAAGGVNTEGGADAMAFMASARAAAHARLEGCEDMRDKAYQELENAVERVGIGVRRGRN